eukprot:9843199-Prorocentrum_lima.AAC.1
MLRPLRSMSPCVPSACPRPQRSRRRRSVWKVQPSAQTGKTCWTDNLVARAPSQLHLPSSPDGVSTLPA